MNHAIRSRTFQFEAGPKRHRFFACEEHVVELSKAPMCFLMFLRDEDKADQVHDVEEELSCYFCREE